MGSVLVAHNQSFVKLQKTSNSFNLEWVLFPPHVSQLEYTTHLDPAHWINVGGPITATNYTTIVSDAVGTDTQRYYRNILLPKTMTFFSASGPNRCSKRWHSEAGLHATGIVEQLRLADYAEGVHREREQLLPYVKHSIQWQSALRAGEALRS